MGQHRANGWVVVESLSDADLDAILSVLFVKPTLPKTVSEPTVRACFGSSSKLASRPCVMQVSFGAPLHSLTHRLAQYLACLDQHNGGAKGVAVFWAEVVLELR